MGKKKYEDEKLHNEEYYFILACRMVQTTGIKIENIQNGGKGESTSPGRPRSRR